MSSLSKRGEKTAPRVSEEELKWLNWPDFVQVRQPWVVLLHLLHACQLMDGPY